MMSERKKTMTEYRWIGVIGRIGTPTADRRVITGLQFTRLREGLGVKLFDMRNEICGKVTSIDVIDGETVMAEGITDLSPGTYHIGLAMDALGNITYDHETRTTYLHGELLACQVGEYEDGRHACWPGVQMVVLDL